MKKFLMIMTIAIIMFQSIAFAEIQKSDQVLDEQEQFLNVNQLKKAIDETLDSETKKIVPEFSLNSMIKDASTGKVSFDMKAMFNRALKYFFSEIYVNLHIIIKVIVLVIICALLQNLQSSFGKEGVGEIAFYACYIFLATMLIKSFLEVLNMGKGVIESMVVFMQTFIPTIFTLLITTGNLTTSTVMQPSIIFSIEVVAALMKNIILPLILFYTVLAVVNNISNKAQVSKLADFIKNTGTWSIGIILTIFITILTMQSTVASIADGVGTKSAKFAVSTFIPVVGKLMSDAVETVVGYSLLLKNSISIVGMIVIILICAVPVIKLMALIVVYRLTAAVIQPISDERIVKCISEMANSLTYISATVLSVSVMFLVSVAIMINAGNAAAMMR